MTVSSGLKCCVLLRNSSPLGSLLRMCLGSSVWVSTMRLLTWKPKVTRRGRLFFQLVPSEPRTEEIEFLFWPTPLTDDAHQLTRKSGMFKSLTRAVMFPTPTVHGNNNRKGASQKSGDGLATVVRQMFLSPTASDGKRATMSMDMLRKAKVNGNLSQQIAHSEQSKIGGALNPEWVEWLMGFPPGWTDLDAESAWKDLATRSSRK